jgi:hypothetical protein
MRNQKYTKPVDPQSLTECIPCVGRAHLKCDCPLLGLVSDEDFSEGDFDDDEPTQVRQ